MRARGPAMPHPLAPPRPRAALGAISLLLLVLVVLTPPAACAKAR